MRKKNITLLILQMIMIEHELIVNEAFVNLLNDFIYDNHKKYQELFKLIFDIELLEEYINENTNIVEHSIFSLNTILTLLDEYDTKEKYFELLEEIDYETSSKLNELALLFFNYFYEQLESTVQVITPYSRILN